MRTVASSGDEDHEVVVRLHFPLRPETPAMTVTGETSPADLLLVANRPRAQLPAGSTIVPSTT